MTDKLDKIQVAERWREEEGRKEGKEERREREKERQEAPESRIDADVRRKLLEAGVIKATGRFRAALAHYRARYDRLRAALVARDTACSLLRVREGFKT